MRRLGSVCALLLSAFCCSCGTFDYYKPSDIVVVPEGERAILFGGSKTTTLVRQKIEQKYDYKALQWGGTVLDIMDLRTPFCPLAVGVEVREAGWSESVQCFGTFSERWRAAVFSLRKGDTITVVGTLNCLRPDGLKFSHCALLRAERDGKQIYPPPEADKKP